MRALPDVASVDFDIPAETFIVDLAEDGESAAVLGAIEKLGYEPKLLESPPATAPATKRILRLSAASLKAALARARERGVPLVVDCGGGFCPACLAFKRDVLSDSGVRKALAAFEFLEVDVEDDEAAASDLGVTAVPDIWIFSCEGVVLGRENRTMNAREFLEVLERHAKE